MSFHLKNYVNKSFLMTGQFIKSINLFLKMMKRLIIIDIILWTLQIMIKKSLKSKTKVISTSLLDQTPSDPSTVLTTMIKAKKITNKAGQNINIFTADQQLYRVALEVTWMEPNCFQNVITSIGGMHWIMSFVGSTGVLMKNSGLLPWLKSTFGGVEKLLTGKKFPLNVRVLRFAMLEHLRNYIEERNIKFWRFWQFPWIKFIQKCSLKALGCKFH